MGKKWHSWHCDTGFLSSDILTQTLLKSDGQFWKNTCYFVTHNLLEITTEWHLTLLTHTHNSHNSVSDTWMVNYKFWHQKLSKEAKTGASLYWPLSLFWTISISEYKMDVRHNEINKIWHARDTGVLKSWHCDSHKFLATHVDRYPSPIWGAKLVNNHSAVSVLGVRRHAIHEIKNNQVYCILCFVCHWSYWYWTSSTWWRASSSWMVNTRLLHLPSSNSPTEKAWEVTPIKFSKKIPRQKLPSSFFGNRVVNEWNSLPQDVISAPNVSRGAHSHT